MHGQKSCKHRFDKTVTYLGGRGHLLKCRCGKMKKAWGLYPRLPGTKPQQRNSDDREQQNPTAE